MTAYALLFTLAAFGISETAYLIRKRKANQKPYCVIGSACELVLTSKYNKTLGFHNDILGLLFYSGMALVLGALVVFEGTFLGTYMLLLADIGVAIGVLFSASFVFIMWRILKAWCFWCLTSAITIGIMALLLLYLSLNML